jgi:hypothetical protein
MSLLLRVITCAGATRTGFGGGSALRPKGHLADVDGTGITAPTVDRIIALIRSAGVKSV